jgi:hypothetical protein
LGFDLIVFHTCVDSARRSDGDYFERVLERARPLAGMSGVKVALPQDECAYTDRLNAFVNAMRIDVVFTCAEESEWKVIYPSVDHTRVRFARVMPGYLDQASLTTISRLMAEARPRSIDIGYRSAFRAEWGRFGASKKRVADAFQARAAGIGLTLDLSDRSEDFFVGDDWYRFLLRLKYTLGAESGGSLLDVDGTVSKLCRAYVREHPGATFEEIESACFSGRDRTVRLRAAAPRHLEACATRTCQILVEGDYSGILAPWVHYIPVKEDMSNIDEVLRIVREDRLRHSIVEAAHRDIVASGKYTYDAMVSRVLAEAIGNDAKRVPKSVMAGLARALNNTADRAAWLKLGATERTKATVRRILPEPALRLWRGRHALGTNGTAP